MNDTEVAAYAMARTALVVTYDSGGRPVAPGRATGFFFDAGDLKFAVTNTHALEAYCARRYRREDVRLQLSVKPGEQGPEEHEGYQLMPQVDEVEGAVASLYGFKDIGLVELKADVSALVAQHKAFVRLDELSTEPLQVGEEVIFRGYPHDNVEFHVDLPGVWAEGYTHFTQVLRTTSRNIAIDRQEGRIVFGSGKVDQARNLHGISGSAMFDRAGRLRGVIWGGDGAETWACPAAEVLACVQRYRETPGR